MSDTRAHLYAAVCADPHDDTLRLAFADWLDEHGDTHDADLAEFIRAGVELAKAGPPHKSFGAEPGNFPGPVGMLAAGPDYWRFWDESLPVAGVGDRVDVKGSVGASTKVRRWHGLLVTRVTDEGSNGIQYVVKRDEHSKPWPGKTLAPRLAELESRHGDRWRKCPCPHCKGYGRMGLGMCLVCGGTGDLMKFRLEGRGGGVEQLRELTFARGFPDAVGCRLDEVGAEEGCAQCGRHGYGVIDAWGNTRGYAPCSACDGTGRTFTPSAWGAAVVRATPVTRFVASDREPYWNGGAHCWFKSSRPNPSRNVPDSAVLPDVIFDEIPATPDKPAGRSRARGFDAIADAADALALALGRLVRRAVYGYGGGNP